MMRRVSDLRQSDLRTVARISALAVLALIVIWYALFIVRWRPAGAIGNDPSTYVQMALDLAATGSPTHRFNLWEQIFDREFSWYAFVTPGYRIASETGVAAPTYAFGTSLLLAVAYRMFGELGIYWTVPLLGGLSVVMTFLVGLELFVSPIDHDPFRYIASAIAVLLLATTLKQLTLALTPMSDVPAQLFALITLWCALLAARQRSTAAVLLAAACGASLGMAYLIRHTVALMWLPIALVAAHLWGATRSAKAHCIVAALATFGLVTLPDFIYRSHVFGGITVTESPDASRVGLQYVADNLARMSVNLTTWRGFGPLILLAPVGVASLYLDQHSDRRRFAAPVLAAWFAAFGMFHLPLVLTTVYENELRYILPAYPALTLAMGAGLVWTLDLGWRQLRRVWKRYNWQGCKGSAFVTGNLVRVCISCVGLVGFFSIALAFAFATRAIVRSPLYVGQAYGWLSPAARYDFDALKAWLPGNAVVGTNEQLAGATMLYTGADVYLPSRFVEHDDELARFLRLMQSRGRPVYVIGDPHCPESASETERLPAWVWLGHYNLTYVGLALRNLPYACEQRIYQVT